MVGYEGEHRVIQNFLTHTCPLFVNLRVVRGFVCIKILRKQNNRLANFLQRSQTGHFQTSTFIIPCSIFHIEKPVSSKGDQQR
jgi:hypothetical protein